MCGRASHSLYPLKHHLWGPALIRPPAILFAAHTKLPHKAVTAELSSEQKAGGNK